MPSRHTIATRFPNLPVVRQFVVGRSSMMAKTWRHPQKVVEVQVNLTIKHYITLTALTPQFELVYHHFMTIFSHEVNDRMHPFQNEWLQKVWPFFVWHHFDIPCFLLGGAVHSPVWKHQNPPRKLQWKMGRSSSVWILALPDAEPSGLPKQLVYV